MTQLLQDTDALWIAALLLAAMFAVHEVCWRNEAEHDDRDGGS